MATTDDGAVPSLSVANGFPREFRDIWDAGTLTSSFMEKAEVEVKVE